MDSFCSRDLKSTAFSTETAVGIGQSTPDTPHKTHPRSPPTCPDPHAGDNRPPSPPGRRTSAAADGRLDVQACSDTLCELCLEYAVSHCNLASKQFCCELCLDLTPTSGGTIPLSEGCAHQGCQEPAAYFCGELPRAARCYCASECRKPLCGCVRGRGPRGAAVSLCERGRGPLLDTSVRGRRWRARVRQRACAAPPPASNRVHVTRCAAEECAEVSCLDHLRETHSSKLERAHPILLLSRLKAEAKHRSQQYRIYMQQLQQEQEQPPPPSTPSPQVQGRSHPHSKKSKSKPKPKTAKKKKRPSSPTEPSDPSPTREALRGRSRQTPAAAAHRQVLAGQQWRQPPKTSQLFPAENKPAHDTLEIVGGAIGKFGPPKPSSAEEAAPTPGARPAPFALNLTGDFPTLGAADGAASPAMATPTSLASTLSRTPTPTPPRPAATSLNPAAAVFPKPLSPTAVDFKPAQLGDFKPSLLFFPPDTERVFLRTRERRPPPFDAKPPAPAASLPPSFGGYLDADYFNPDFLGGGYAIDSRRLHYSLAALALV